MRRFRPGVTCCARCGQPILFAADAHLDHAPGSTPQRPKYLGLSHAKCNIGAAAATRSAIYQAGKSALAGVPVVPVQRAVQPPPVIDQGRRRPW
jgi:hypothetical protein